jgi:hypothetical protein
VPPFAGIFRSISTTGEANALQARLRRRPASMMPQSAALVCVGGQPGVAAMTLLRYRGDFDRAGCASGTSCSDSYPSSRGGSTPPPTGPRRARCLRLDPELAENKRRTGHAVEEERVLDDLLADLDRSAPPQ